MAISSVLPLLVVVFLFIIVGNFGFSRIAGVRQQISQSQRDKAVLGQKLDLLSTVSATVATEATIASVAVPAGNSVLAVIWQLKTLGVGSGVLLSNIKAAAEVKDESGLSRSDVSFEVSGARSSVLAFLKGISEFAPLVVLDKIKLNEIGGAVRANIALKSFWSEFPTKLPATTEPITDLTTEERKILGELSALRQPAFVEIPAAAQTSGRSDPFGP